MIATVTLYEVIDQLRRQIVNGEQCLQAVFELLKVKDARHVQELQSLKDQLELAKLERDEARDAVKPLHLNQPLKAALDKAVAQQLFIDSVRRSFGK